jgi:hypothetical protein
VFFHDTGVPAGKITLRAYNSCDDALKRLRAAAKAVVGPYGIGNIGYGYGVAEGAGGAPGRADDKALTPQPNTGNGSTDGTTHSGTNTQEADVDEPDLVKTDGKRIVVAHNGELRVIDPQTRQETAKVRFDTTGGAPAANLLLSGDHVLVLTLGYIAYGKGIAIDDVAVPGVNAANDPQAVNGATFYLIDLNGGARVVASYVTDGVLLDARQVGDTARVIVRSAPRLVFPDVTGTDAQRIEAYKKAIDNTPIEDWLPRFSSTAGGQTGTGHVACSAVARPSAYTGTSMTSIFTFDLTKNALGTGLGATVVADGSQVYGSSGNLYIASDLRWRYAWPFAVNAVEGGAVPPPAQPGAVESAGGSGGGSGSSGGTSKPGTGGQPGSGGGTDSVSGSTGSGGAATGTGAKPPAAASSASPVLPPDAGTSAKLVPTTSPTPRKPQLPRPGTDIYKFDLTKPGPARFVAAGNVPGWTLSQYAFSEFEGDLRVATTTDNSFAGAEFTNQATDSGVYVLRQSGNKLAVVGSVTGLGKGERIYAVRFIGTVGYVVTFRQMDPLYTVDLRDPTKPAVTGALKIDGYSSYLHPIGNGLIIGIGQDTGTSTGQQGTQVSLFNVIDPANPIRLDRVTYPWSKSEAEYDPHAFLYWPDRHLLVIPIVTWATTPGGPAERVAPGGGAVVLRVDGDQLTEVGTLTVTAGQADYMQMIRRNLVVGDSIWSITDSGALASDLTTLTKQAYLPFQ